MNSQIDAYAAGLFDGEGNIGAGQTRGAWTIACHTGMTVKARAVLDGLCGEYGGRVRKHREATDKWAEAWTWSLHGTEAAAFLTRIRPFLRLKRDIADVALQMERVRLELEPFAPGSTRRRWTPEASERCAKLHREIKRMNRRGPEVEPPPGWIARLVDGQWMSPQADLFTDTGWAPFSGRWPRSGMTRGGALYELPTPVPPTGEPASSSLPTPSSAVQLLPTPTSMDSAGSRNSTVVRPEGSTANIGDTLTDAVTVLVGDRTRARSAAGKPSSDDPHPTPPNPDATDDPDCLPLSWNG